METLKILQRMRDVLESYGWAKGALYRMLPVTVLYVDGRPDEFRPAGMCLEGACLTATGVDWASALTAEIDKLEKENLPVAALLARVIVEQYPDRRTGFDFDSWDIVTSFNDDPETILEDVYAVIDKAIARE